MDQKQTYEGMFLLDAGNPDFEAAGEPIRNVLARSEAEILTLNPWDERRLAYGIEGRKRGLYALAYFKADPSRIVEIEHDCRLNEHILRVLFLRKDGLTVEEINADTPATANARKAAEREAAKAAEEQSRPDEAEDMTDEPVRAPIAEPAEASADESESAEEAATGEDDAAEEGVVDLTSDETPESE